MFHDQSLLVSQLLLDMNTDQWDSYLEFLELTDSSVIWQTTSHLKGKKRTCHSLITQNGTMYFEKGKAEFFANCMEDQFTIYGGVCDLTLDARVSNFLSEYFYGPPSFDRADLVSVLRCQNKRKTLGPDRISSIVLRDLGNRHTV